MSDLFLSEDVRKTLSGKHVILLGDSNIRGLYKDIIWLLNDDSFIPYECLGAKGEPHFPDFDNWKMDDKRISNRVRSIFDSEHRDKLLKFGGLHSGRGYIEPRSYYHPEDNIHLHFMFLTRVWSKDLEDYFGNFEARHNGAKIDVVLMSSCLWDFNRWGPFGIKEYKENLNKLVKKVKDSLQKEGQFVWLTSLPTSEELNSKAMQIPGLEFQLESSRYNVVEANFYAAHKMAENDYHVVDLHNYALYQSFRRNKDGIHWSPESNRWFTNLILTYVCLILHQPLPGRVKNNLSLEKIKLMAEVAKGKLLQQLTSFDVNKKLEELTSLAKTLTPQHSAILSEFNQMGLKPSKRKIAKGENRVHPYKKPKHLIKEHPSFRGPRPNRLMMDEGFRPMNRGFGPWNEGFRPMNSGFGPMNRGFETMNEGFGPMNPGFGPVNQGFETMNPGFRPMNRGFGPMNQGFGPVNQGFGPMNQGFGPRNVGFGPMNLGFGPNSDGFGPMMQPGFRPPFRPMNQGFGRPNDRPRPLMDESFQRTDNYPPQMFNRGPMRPNPPMNNDFQSFAEDVLPCFNNSGPNDSFAINNSFPQQSDNCRPLFNRSDPGFNFPTNEEYPRHNENSGPIFNRSDPIDSFSLNDEYPHRNEDNRPIFNRSGPMDSFSTNDEYPPRQSENSRSLFNRSSPNNIFSSNEEHLSQREDSRSVFNRLSPIDSYPANDEFSHRGDNFKSTRTNDSYPANDEFSHHGDNFKLTRTNDSFPILDDYSPQRENFRPAFNTAGSNRANESFPFIPDDCSPQNENARPLIRNPWSSQSSEVSSLGIRPLSEERITSRRLDNSSWEEPILPPLSHPKEERSIELGNRLNFLPDSNFINPIYGRLLSAADSGSISRLKETAEDND